MDDNKQITQDAGTPNATNNEDNKGGKTFSQDEVNNIVSDRVKEIKAKNEQAIKDAVSNAIAEYERQAKLTEEEREKEAKTKRELELKEREEQLILRENRILAQELLAKQNIPIDLVDFVVNLDANKTKDNIEKLATTYNKSVANGVTDKLKGTPPKDFSNNNNDNVDKVKKNYSAF